MKKDIITYQNPYNNTGPNESLGKIRSRKNNKALSKISSLEGLPLHPEWLQVVLNFLP